MRPGNLPGLLLCEEQDQSEKRPCDADDRVLVAPLFGNVANRLQSRSAAL
jgi:hypothetical protein